MLPFVAMKDGDEAVVEVTVPILQISTIVVIER